MVDSPSITTSDTYSWRQISPVPGLSIFITCAPISANRKEAEGPDKNWLKSMTNMSFNRSIISYLREFPIEAVKRESSIGKRVFKLYELPTIHDSRSNQLLHHFLRMFSQPWRRLTRDQSFSIYPDRATGGNNFVVCIQHLLYL